MDETSSAEVTGFSATQVDPNGDNNRSCTPSRMTPRLLLIASPNKRKASTLPVLAFGARSAAGRPARMTAGLVVAAMSGTPSTLAGYAPPASINGLRRNASPVSSGRHTRIGTRSDLLILALDGQAALTLNPKPAFGFTSAAEAIPLPKMKPRALREDFVVPSIRSREVARAQRSIVRRCEDALYPLDFVFPAAAHFCGMPRLVTR